MIRPRAWKNDLEVMETTDPIPLEEWLEKVTRRGYQLVKLPEDTLIQDGRYAGGQVIVVTWTRTSSCSLCLRRLFPCWRDCYPTRALAGMLAHGRVKGRLATTKESGE